MGTSPSRSGGACVESPNKDWGYATLVEINGKRILFDAGDDPAILARSVKSKGVDLNKLDFVVLSHRHSVLLAHDD
jgi:7,8-dihydropterin-6-yl-methyl-4-(beta-D-ribofuranosyl)aminobenzene 5'-phosphate synthase